MNKSTIGILVLDDESFIPKPLVRPMPAAGLAGRTETWSPRVEQWQAGLP